MSEHSKHKFIKANPAYYVSDQILIESKCVVCGCVRLIADDQEGIDGRSVGDIWRPISGLDENGHHAATDDCCFELAKRIMES